MNEQNEFNFNSQNFENNFKQVKPKKTHSFGKTIFIPFCSGIVGASLILGIAFGVPSIKNKLLSNSVPSITQTSSETSSYAGTLINLEEYSNTSVAVANKVLPSIVGITVNYNVSSIFGNSTSKATGSGIIISEDGYILTNNHVISSENSSSYYSIAEATGITVNLYNDTTDYEATVIGTDSYTDLAVIKIEKTDLIAADLGNSDNVQIGEFVMAVGNPLGMTSSVTTGVVSAVNREVSDGENNTFLAIQTDTAINSGNSGGALVNSKGEVIGINTLKIAGDGVEGMGFAIPISSTTDVVNQLIEYQTVKRPYIGISGSEVEDSVSQKYNIPKGVYVKTVEKDSPAEKAGIKPSDIITKIEGTEVSSVTELNRVKNNKKIGDTVTLTIIRNNQEMEISLELGEMPDEETEEQVETTPNSNNSNGNNRPEEPNQGGSFSIFDIFR